MSASKIGGRWDVGFKNRWEVVLVGGGLSKLAGDWSEEQVEMRLRPPPHTLWCTSRPSPCHA